MAAGLSHFAGYAKLPGKDIQGYPRARPGLPGLDDHSRPARRYRCIKGTQPFRVKGEISGHSGDSFFFRTSLFPAATNFTLLVNKRMQSGAKVTRGSVATFRLEPDADEREVAGISGRA